MDHHYEENPTADEVKVLTTLNQQMLQAEEVGNQAVLDPLLVSDFTIVRASGVRQDRQTFLKAVPDNAHRGRIADQLEIHPYGDCAVVIIRVTTSQNKDGAPAIGHFWNIRTFIRQSGEWHCVAWQVTEIKE